MGKNHGEGEAGRGLDRAIRAPGRRPLKLSPSPTRRPPAAPIIAVPSPDQHRMSPEDHREALVYPEADRPRACKVQNSRPQRMAHGPLRTPASVFLATR